MRAIALSGLVLATSCGVRFTPETVVNSLRVLSVTAEPPEVEPGAPAEMNVLFADPSRPGQANTVIWVGCEPDPQDLGRSACNDASILVQPTLITTYPPGLKLLGFGPRAFYASTPGVFDPLATDDPIRQSGTVGQVLALVVGEEIGSTVTGDQLTAVFQRIQDHQTQAVVALARVLVSQSAVKNHNPVVQTLTFDGALLPLNARLQVKPGQQVALGVAVPDASRELYTEQLPSGPVQKQEQVVGSWYSTAGRFTQERFDVTTTDPSKFIAPGSAQFPEDPVPDKRFGQLWLVVRDNRGGQAFKAFRFYVVDESLPAPTVRAVQVPTNPTDQVVVTGDHMEAVLDIVVGDVALANGTYSGARGGFVGDQPALPSGTYPMRVRGMNGSDADTGLTYTVP